MISRQSRLQHFDHFWATITPRELEEFEIKPCVAAAAGTRHKFEAMWLIDEEDIEFNRSHIHNVGTFACGLVDEPFLHDEEWTVSWLAEGDLSDIEIIDRDVPVGELRHYACPVCGYWHLSKKDRSVNRAAAT